MASVNYTLRNFVHCDTAAINHVAMEAFKEYQQAYSDWTAFSNSIGNMAALSNSGELVVATAGRSIIGAVVYVGPEKPKSPFFEPAWSIIRMLVVHPESRGQGIGRALTEECIRRARRDTASCIALHTTSIMKMALTMYLKMGFEFHREAPTIFGVPYGIYLKQLNRVPTKHKKDKEKGRVTTRT